MKKYIEQIIKIIDEAKKIPLETYIDKDFYYGGESFYENIFSQEITFSKILNLKAEELPIPQSLNDEDLKLIFDTLVDFLTSYGFKIFFVDNVPMRLNYELLREYMFGSFHYDKTGLIPWIGFCQDCFSGKKCKLYKYCVAQPKIPKEIDEKIPRTEMQEALGYPKSIQYLSLRIENKILKGKKLTAYFNVVMGIAKHNKINLDWLWAKNVANFEDDYSDEQDTDL